MTDPVILLGTQSNGETLPVQVNEYGQLVAEGIQGEEGPQGPEGPEGPEGPPGADGKDGKDGADGTNGIGVPVPLGNEGDYLRIIDGATAWDEGDGGGGGVPDPSGLPDGLTLRTKDGEAAWTYDDFSPYQHWSSTPFFTCAPYAAFDGGHPLRYLFDGNTESMTYLDGGIGYEEGFKLIFPFEVTIDNLIFYAYTWSPGSWVEYSCQGTTHRLDTGDTGGVIPMIFSRLTGMTVNPGTPLSIKSSQSQMWMTGIMLNNYMLIDSPEFNRAIQYYLSKRPPTEEIPPPAGPNE